MPTHARHKKAQDRPVVMYFLTCGCRSFSLISQSGQSKLSNRRSSIADIFLKFQGMLLFGGHWWPHMLLRWFPGSVVLDIWASKMLLEKVLVEILTFTANVFLNVWSIFHKLGHFVGDWFWMIHSGLFNYSSVLWRYVFYNDLDLNFIRDSCFAINLCM